EDSATLGAVERYRETVRAEAPWLPNNVDFLQRINGLAVHHPWPRAFGGQFGEHGGRNGGARLQAGRRQGHG
ncbi:hypothetical protein R0G64_31595, partial [Pseudomonas otitidis]